MEACAIKPQVKKKTTEPTKRNDPANWKKPTPPVPERPSEDELIQTQYRKKIAAKNEDIGGLLAGMFRKTAKEKTSPSVTVSEAGEPEDESAESADEEKGGFFSGILKKTDETPAQDVLGVPGELSASNGSLSDNGNKKEKGGIFSGMFRKKSARAPQTNEDERSLQTEPNGNEAPSEDGSKKGGVFAGMFRKSPKLSEAARLDEGNLSASDESLSEAANVKEGSTEKRSSGSCEDLSAAGGQKEKKGGLAGFFKRSASIDNLFDEEKGGLFSGLVQKPPKARADAAEDRDEQKDASSSDDLFESGSTKEKSTFSGMFKKGPKPAEETPADEESRDEKTSPGSRENLSEGHASKVKAGGLAGIFKKSPQPAHRSVASNDPLNDPRDLSASCDDLVEDIPSEMTTSADNLIEATNPAKEKKAGFANKFKRTPKTQEDESPREADGPRCRTTVKRKKRVVSFRIKKTPPKIPERSQSSPGSEMIPLIEETFELQELSSALESRVEHQPVEMAAYPTEGNPTESQDTDDDLMDWWNTVKGWAEWNETSHFQEGDEQMAMEQAADRVYMAARLFVRFFNRRGASLQHRILELLALADAADEFHKKAVKAAVGGGVASVAGSLATITGLILAPFTFGASIIVTAVGIGVATAGSITSATANITDAVHSNMDRKKLEKMIVGYQDEIKDIRECLDFVQAGMDTLQRWDFEKYSESAGKKAQNHNLKHVMREGGRAGKALMINTDKLIRTVQVLGAAGGAAKAAQAVSITTGVMSALFLALDLFFLAKDSHELRKGAKTKFATKIRDVCKELQDGLLELNKVKTQLQKTMDGIEVEEYEEMEEVEEEVDDDYESDPKKLAELEQELDLLEEKLDKKVDEGLKNKEKEKEMLMSKEEKGEPEEKKDKEEKVEAKNEGKMESKKRKIPDEEKEQKSESVKAAKEERAPKGKKVKDAENQVTAEKEKHQSKRDLATEDNEANEKLGEKNGDSKREERGGKPSTRTGGGSDASPSGREEEGEKKPGWRPRNKDAAAEGLRRSTGTGSRPEAKGTGKEMERRKGGRDAERGAEERRGSRSESARRRFETRGGEENGNREEDGETRGSDKGMRGSDRAMSGSGEGIRGSDRARKGNGEGTRGSDGAMSGSGKGIRGSDRARKGNGEGTRGSDGALSGSGEGIKAMRGSDKGMRGSDRRPRPTPKALLEDGLNI